MVDISRTLLSLIPWSLRDRVRLIPGLAAFSRPLGYHKKVLRKTPGGIGLKHLILKNEILGICPVIGNFAGIMIAHDIRYRCSSAGRIVGALATGLSTLRAGDKAIHLSTINIKAGVDLPVRTAIIFIGSGVVGVDAGPGFWICYADRELSILDGQAIRTGVGAKIMIKGAVLLHNNYNMLDL